MSFHGDDKTKFGSEKLGCTIISRSLVDVNRVPDPKLPRTHESLALAKPEKGQVNAAFAIERA